MPKLSDTMTTGTLIKWLKNEGDEVSAGDMIAEVETDKATMEVEVFEDGVILKHYVSEGDSVPIGGPICAIGEEGEDAPEAEVQTAEPEADDDAEDEDEEDGEDDSTEEPEEKSGDEEEDEAGKKKAGKKKAKKDSKDKKDKDKDEESESEESESEAEEEESDEEEEETASPKPAPKRDGGGRIKASPLARKVAGELGVDLADVEGTGPGGRIVREDVEKASKSPKPKKAAKAPESRGPAFTLGSIEEKTEKVSNMRSAIAKILVKSKTEAPHFYLQSEVDAEALSTIRQDLNSFLAELPAEQGGIKFTVNDLILKAAAMAALQVPQINRSWQGEKIKQSGAVHLAFGVAVDEGLVTPVIRDAETKSLRQISTEARELIKKARNKKLKPDEMSGSTLTVTNLGMYGISDFYGIINPGNAAILSVGSTVKKPVVNEHDQIVVGYRMKVGLSGDHRVIDGAVGAEYLDALRRILEKPSILIA